MRVDCYGGLELKKPIESQTQALNPKLNSPTALNSRTPTLAEPQTTSETPNYSLNALNPKPPAVTGDPVPQSVASRGLVKRSGSAKGILFFVNDLWHVIVRL